MIKCNMIKILKSLKYIIQKTMKPHCAPSHIAPSAQTSLQPLPHHCTPSESSKSAHAPPIGCISYQCQHSNKCRFLDKFSICERYLWLVGTEIQIKIAPLIAKNIKKKKKKSFFSQRIKKKNGMVNKPTHPPNHPVSRTL